MTPSSKNDPKLSTCDSIGFETESVKVNSVSYGKKESSIKRITSPNIIPPRITKQFDLRIYIFQTTAPKTISKCSKKKKSMKLKTIRNRDSLIY